MPLKAAPSRAAPPPQDLLALPADGLCPEPRLAPGVKAGESAAGAALRGRGWRLGDQRRRGRGGTAALPPATETWGWMWPQHCCVSRSTYPSVYVSVSLPVHCCIYRYTYPSMYVCMYLSSPSTPMSTNILIHLCMYVCMYLFLALLYLRYIYLSIYLHI